MKKRKEVLTIFCPIIFRVPSEVKKKQQIEN